MHLPEMSAFRRLPRNTETAVKFIFMTITTFTLCSCQYLKGEFPADLYEDCSQYSSAEFIFNVFHIDDSKQPANSNFTKWKNQVFAENHFLIKNAADHGMDYLEAVESGSLSRLKHLVDHYYTDVLKHFSHVITPKCGIFKKLADNHLIKFVQGVGAVKTTLLIEAALRGHSAQMAFLLRNLGADPFTSETNANTGYMAIHAAAEVGSLQGVRHLLALHPELVEARDAHDRTALLLASKFDHLPIVKEIIENGYDANALAVDEDQWTALHHASNSGHDDVIQYLVERYPELISAKTKLGETPVDVYQWTVEEMPKKPKFITVQHKQ